MYKSGPRELENFTNKELRIEGYTHTPTDYYRNTVMEPEAISTLRPSFGEYEAMGERHKALTSQINSLNEAMKMSRQRGAFQALQNQMKAVRSLVKEREEVDAKMSVADSVRKKTDDHKIASGLETSYSEQLGSVKHRITQLENMMVNFAEQTKGEYDFTRCVRPDGSAYGTRGKCKKGTEGGPAPVKEGAINEGAKVAVNPAKTTTQKPRQTTKELKATAAKMESAYKEAYRREKVAQKERRSVEKETKGDNSPEARKKRGDAQKAHENAQILAKRALSASIKTHSLFIKSKGRDEKAKMTPEQKAASRALDKEMKMRG